MVRRVISFLLCYLVFGSTVSFCTGSAVPDTAKIVYDSSRMEWEGFDNNKIDNYRQDSDFSYHQKLRRTEGISLWDRFWMWFFSMIRSMFEVLNININSQLLTVLTYLIPAGVLLYIVLRMVGVDMRGLLYRRSESTSLAYKISEENIHEMDFDQMIEEAIQNQEYRKGVRLFYLSSLKKLTDRNIIEWRPGKTNHEYSLELQSSKVNHAFKDLSYYFEYIWYGNFPVDKRIFNEAQKSFKLLIDQVRSL